MMSAGGNAAPPTITGITRFALIERGLDHDGDEIVRTGCPRRKRLRPARPDDGEQHITSGDSPADHLKKNRRPA